MMTVRNDPMAAGTWRSSRCLGAIVAVRATSRVPTPAAWSDVTDRMRRLLAESSASPPVLTLLAERGSTGKTRNSAQNRARGR
ncbi:hypothetical protein [Streptomyces sp. NPDC057052]|uniref:hypothetical protein n=1 Tax=Streptomyces sp. NPDC057052 TaxID=3346010 RepID=UPI003630B42F